MNSDAPNPQAFYWANEQWAFLDRADYIPAFRQAAKDWYGNVRAWRPVTEELYNYSLNAVPPLTMARGFIAGEPACHTCHGRGVYCCFRRFNSVPHLIYATVEEFFHEDFSILNL